MGTSTVMVDMESAHVTFEDAVTPCLQPGLISKTRAVSRKSYTSSSATLPILCMNSSQQARFHEISPLRKGLIITLTIFAIVGAWLAFYVYSVFLPYNAVDDPTKVIAFAGVLYSKGDFISMCLQASALAILCVFGSMAIIFSHVPIVIPRRCGRDVSRAMNTFVLVFALVPVIWVAIYVSCVRILSMDRGTAAFTIATLCILHIMAITGVFVTRARQTVEARIKGTIMDDRFHVVLWYAFIYPYIAYERGTRLSGQTIANARLTPIGRHYVRSISALIFCLFAVILPLSLVTTGVDIATVVSVLLAITSFALVVTPVHLITAVHDAAVYTATVDVLAVMDVEIVRGQLPDPVSPMGIADVVALVNTHCRCKGQGKIPIAWTVEGIRHRDSIKLGESMFVLSNGSLVDVLAVVTQAVDKDLAPLVFGGGMCCSCALNMATALRRKVVVGPLVSKSSHGA